MKQQSKLLKVISILLIIFGAFGLIGNLASIFLIGPMMNTPEMVAVYEAAGVTQPGTMYYVFSIVSCLVEITAGIVGVMYRSKKSVLIAGAVWTVVVIIGMIWGVVLSSFTPFTLLSLLFPILYLWGWYQSN